MTTITKTKAELLALAWGAYLDADTAERTVVARDLLAKVQQATEANGVSFLHADQRMVAVTIELTDDEAALLA